jgi:glutamine synthetase
MDSFAQFKAPATRQAFKGVLTAVELESRYDISLEIYSEQILIELRCALDIAQTQIIPAAIKEQALRGESLKNLQKASVKLPKNSEQLKELQLLVNLIDEGISNCQEICQFLEKIKKLNPSEKAHTLSKKGVEHLEDIRSIVDKLEKLVNNDLWPLPKYRELLFIV